MRALWLVMVLGCGHDMHMPADAPIVGESLPPTPDADPSECTKPMPPPLCDHFAGACIDGVCRRMCYVTQLPRCDAGFAETHRTIDGADVCYCVPE